MRLSRSMRLTQQAVKRPDAEKACVPYPEFAYLGTPLTKKNEERFGASGELRVNFLTSIEFGGPGRPAASDRIPHHVSKCARRFLLHGFAGAEITLSHVEYLTWHQRPTFTSNL